MKLQFGGRTWREFQRGALPIALLFLGNEAVQIRAQGGGGLRSDGVELDRTGDPRHANPPDVRLGVERAAADGDRARGADVGVVRPVCRAPFGGVHLVHGAAGLWSTSGVCRTSAGTAQRQRL
jgi:hypothetical protein